VRQSRAARLVLLGEGKRRAAERVLGTSDHDPSWPATIVHRCRDGQVWLDMDADPGARPGVEALPTTGPDPASFDPR
jgi:hypothetical protein